MRLSVMRLLHLWVACGWNSPSWLSAVYHRAAGAFPLACLVAVGGDAQGALCIEGSVQTAILCGCISTYVVTRCVHCHLISVGGLGNLMRPLKRLLSL